MRYRLREAGEWVWYAILVIVVVAVLALGTLAIQRVVYPWWLSVQRTSVEESKSYNDSTNISMSNFIREYTILDSKIAEAGDDANLISAYKSQQGAILSQMCQVYVTMKSVASTTRTFISQHGGCK